MSDSKHYFVFNFEKRSLNIYKNLPKLEQTRVAFFNRNIT